MPRTRTASSPFASSLASLVAAAAGAALPAGTAHAGYVDENSWTITVSADPIGCPGTATVTANFRFRKAAWGGPLGAGTLDVRLYDADPGGVFDPDDLIGKHNVTWTAQPNNWVDLTVTFEVECVETDDGWCTIRGNAGTDDEGDPHEMYIYVEEPNSGTFWNNSWTSPKNEGNWLKYSFPLRCGCGEDAGDPAEYDIAYTPGGQINTVAMFDLPDPTPSSPPVEYFQAFFHTDMSQLDPLDIAIIADGGRATDIFGEPQIQPGPGGFFVGLPVVDPFAAQDLTAIGLEMQFQQADPQAFGMTRIAHNPFETVVVFSDGSVRQFAPTDGEIPLRPFDLEPPVIQPELIQLDLAAPFPLMGQPGAVTDNLDQVLPGQVDLEIQIQDVDGQILFETQRPVNADGSFAVDPGLLPPTGMLVVIAATDPTGNRSAVSLPFTGCNPADIAPPFGVLDLTDVNTFVQGFLNQQPVADINSDGIHDLTDVSQFIGAFNSGCP